MNEVSLWDSLNSEVYNLRRLFTEPHNQFREVQSVIYLIRNDVNLKLYVGQARNYLSRLSDDGRVSHFNDYVDYCKNGGNKLLYKAINKYGSRYFSTRILEITPNLNDRERYWIKRLHTCIYDSDCWGYNMTWGGEDASQLNTPESRSKRNKIILEKYNGDLMGMCHTQTSINKSIETHIKLYGGPVEHMLTEDAQNNLKCSQLFGSINWYINTLLNDGAPNPITWDIYWNWSDGYWNLSNFYYHIRSIYRNLNILRKDSRWNDDLENIFSELESNPRLYKC